MQLKLLKTKNKFKVMEEVEVKWNGKVEKWVDGKKIINRTRLFDFGDGYSVTCRDQEIADKKHQKWLDSEKTKKDPTPEELNNYFGQVQDRIRIKNIETGVGEFDFEDGFSCFARDQKNADRKHNNWLNGGKL